MKASDFIGYDSGKKRRPSQHRDVLEEAARIEQLGLVQGTGGVDERSGGSIGSNTSQVYDSGRGSERKGGSQIFLKNPNSDKSKGGESDKSYDWEIPFKEINLKSRIGGGQFGDVYHGEWLDTEIAVKIPKTEASPDGSEMKKFLREVKLMSTIHHPNIVLFLGACITMPDICLVMEYLPRGSLFDYIHKKEDVGEPPKDKSDLTMMKFAVDCAQGMKYLHHRVHLVQRDLKSHNLLINATMTLKISDFGLSKIHIDGKHSTQKSKNGLGTPYWLAPEVIRNEKETIRADVYSFSIVLWEMFHLEVPHQDLTGPEAAYAVAHKGLRPTLKSGLNSNVAALIRRCWKNRPQDRPEFDEILKILQETLNMLLEKTSNASSPSGSRSSLTLPPSSALPLLNTKGSNGQFPSLPLGTLPLGTPLANYILGSAGPAPVFFGPTSASATATPTVTTAELRKITQARKSGRRASLGSLGTASEKVATKDPGRAGSLEYKPRGGSLSSFPPRNESSLSRIANDEEDSSGGGKVDSSGNVKDSWDETGGAKGGYIKNNRVVPV
ncbi:hypothetical protein TrST_g12605 [Triparma strigata]|uniref:non-specific serine/threonine protein kinase n=1 Tax=Triparma strigata TaxID=1606541 RepID=A0A9W7C1Z5_9STRA|nr:hypothetical protein TrST_g12605 [Triparma strigata]